MPPLIDFVDIFDLNQESRKINDSLIQSLLFNTTAPTLEFTYDADPEQTSFIESNGSTIRLIAPAGSGKTQSIVNRVLKKFSEGKSLRSFLILTFDNSARDSIIDKFDKSLTNLGSANRDTPQVRTLNSFGGGIARSVSPSRDIADEWESGEITRTILKEFKKQYPEKAEYLPAFIKGKVYSQLFSLLKNSIVFSDKLLSGDPETCLVYKNAISNKLEPWIGTWRGTPKEKSVANSIGSIMGNLFHRYNLALLDRNKIDFDDQKLQSYRFLKETPTAVGSLMSVFGEVIVDEFQDINKLDFELIKLIVENKTLVVVGDDDQAIYSFRGCSPDYIINFDQRFGRKGELHILKKNYRCPKNIVHIANKLIANNDPNRVSKIQEPHRTDDALIQFWHCLNAGSEAQIIARTIKKLHDTKSAKGWDYSDVAILIRLNHQCLPLQIALIMEGIPFFCEKKYNILVNEFMARLIGLMNLHLKLVKDKTHHSLEDSRLLMDCLGRVYDDWKVIKFHKEVEKANGYHNVKPDEKLLPWKVTLTDFSTAIRNLSRSGPPKDVIERIGISFKNMGGVMGDLESALNEETAPLGEFADIASRFKGTMEEFYNVISGLKAKAEGFLYQDKEGTGVNILTYFKCKGRQWDTVIIPGANQKIIPQTKKDSNIEDERRIFYVAVTRATANLFFSYVRTTVKSKVEPSQFLAELGLGEAEEKRAGILA